jgi:hypothetical protein
MIFLVLWLNRPTPVSVVLNLEFTIYKALSKKLIPAAKQGNALIHNYIIADSASYEENKR